MRSFSKKRKSQLWLLIWSLTRLVTVTLLWLDAAVGAVVNVLLDAVDGDIFERLGLRRKSYQVWDKWMDLWLITAMAIYAFQFWERDVVWYALMFAFGYRFVGQVIYGVGGGDRVLMVFPNVVMELFLIKTIVPAVLTVDLVMTAPWPILLGLLVYGVFKEWWLHVLKIDISDRLFGGGRW